MNSLNQYILEKFKISKGEKLNNTFAPRDIMVIIKIKVFTKYIYISFCDIACFINIDNEKIYYERNEPWEKAESKYIINSNKIYEYKQKGFERSTLFLTEEQGIEFIEDIVIKENFKNLKNWLDEDEDYINNTDKNFGIEDKKTFEKLLHYLKG